MDSERKGSQLARRQKHSTLTTGPYQPDSSAYKAEYHGVFVNRRAYLLFLDEGGDIAFSKAKNLATSPNFKTLLEATSTACDSIETQLVRGTEIDWSGELTVISASRSGHYETGVQKPGAIRAIVLSGSHHAVPETLCIDNALASIIDSSFPYISRFDLLPELTDRDMAVFLGMTVAKKLPRTKH